MGTLGGESAEAFVDWLHGFLSKPDMEFYLDPAKKLDNDFLNDLGQVTTHQRIALMVDTYEQMSTLDDWMRELVQRLPNNVLLVIASRTVPEWNRAWQEWMGKAEIVELKEMSTDDLRTLVYRYYAYIRTGNPDPRQVEAIVQFARGLPMVATTVVQLWVKYGAEDFQTVRPQVVADLADRLLEGVPPQMRPAFEAAAVLRYFNVDALAALLEEGDAEWLYAELRRWPFIRARREGLAVHDTMREMINEALRLRTLKRFRTLHERAATYYEEWLEKATGDERERYPLERLYHRVCADEVSGIQLFQEQAEELTRYRFVNRLRALLNDVNTYSLEQESSDLWRRYYNARLAHLEAHFMNAEEIYKEIGENERVEPKLRAYALCDWGEILRRRGRSRQPYSEEKAIQVLELSLKVGGTIDLKLAMSWLNLSYIYSYSNNVGREKALLYLKQPKDFFTKRGDSSGLLTVLDYERLLYYRQGNLRKTFDIENEMRKIYAKAGEPPYLRIRIPPTWEWAWAGRYAESEKEFLAVLEIAKSLQDQEYLVRRTRELVFHLGLQGKCAEALTLAEHTLSIVNSLESWSDRDGYLGLAMNGIVCLKCGNLNRAEEYLNQAIKLAQKIRQDPDIVEMYLANTYEASKEFDKAKHIYLPLQTKAHALGRNYIECSAFTGLVRVKHAQHDYASIPPLLTGAEQLAQQYEYNDYLTSLYLSRAHIAWDDLIAEWDNGFDTALHFYRFALTHALRFNRFLLDEALSGRKQGTLLQPIIPYCLKREKEGLRMLVALRDWWQNGMNDISTPRPDTISPIPEGISLLEAERIAREREPGDDSPQTEVVDQINAALDRFQQTNGENL